MYLDAKMERPAFGWGLGSPVFSLQSLVLLVPSQAPKRIQTPSSLPA